MRGGVLQVLVRSGPFVLFDALFGSRLFRHPVRKFSPWQLEVENCSMDLSFSIFWLHGFWFSILEFKGG